VQCADVISKHVYENQQYCKTETKLKPRNSSEDEIANVN